MLGDQRANDKPVCFSNGGTLLQLGVAAELTGAN
jgi:hypothetical protein